MHNIFCIHVGQCGLQIGFALWELLSAEHGIDRGGIMTSEDEADCRASETFFNNAASGHYVPRGMFIDLEPTVIDQMRSGSYRGLFHPDQMISGFEDAANNFARGFHTVGRIMKRACENRIRREFEVSDRVQALHIYRSLGGGTGSGMTATIFEVLLEYAKLSKVEIPIHPSPHLACAVVEPYNCILSEHFCMEDTDISCLLDNEALYDLVMQQIDMKEVTFHNINRIVAQVCSSLTASSRFENFLYNDFNSLTNLVPYPRIHFPLVSYAPVGSELKLTKSSNTVTEITHSVFDTENQLVKVDPVSGKYMSCSLVYRGDVTPTEIYNAIADVKASRTVRFVDWCPTGFKVGVVHRPPQKLASSMLGYSPRNVVMMTNSSSVSALWHRLAQKFHKLYAKRSFVHWFVAEGLEESEFCESLYNLATLAKDYEEVALDTKLDGLIDNIGGDEGVFGCEGGGAMAQALGGGGGGGGGAGGGEGGAGAGSAVNGDGEGGDGGEDGGDDGGDDDDDDDDDQENASNAVLNTNDNRKINWRKQFESLLHTLYLSKDLSDLSLSSLERNGFDIHSLDDQSGRKKSNVSCTENTDNCNVVSGSTKISPREFSDIVGTSECWQKNEESNRNHSNYNICNPLNNIKKLSNLIYSNRSYFKLESNSLSNRLHKAKIMMDKESESSLVTCSSHPSFIALTASKNGSNQLGGDSDDEETETVSLMEDLIRKTSTSFN